MNQNEQLQKYKTALTQIPTPGGGGCHAALLGVANHGAMAGVEPQQMLADIRANIPQGGRVVPDSEIVGAINKAGVDLKQNGDIKIIKPDPAIDGPMFVRAILEAGKDISMHDLIDASPADTEFHTEGDLNRQIVALLDALYTPDERLFIGDRTDTEVKTVEVWKADASSIIGPYIIPNPLTGEQGQTKDGKPSYRADSCVASFRFAVVEFDNMPLQDQYSFWGAVDLPVAALIFSGGKSIHAWLRVDCRDAAEWEAEIENTLYARYLIPMGVDSSCRNEARLSRVPGVYRQDKEQWQPLLYLSPEGRPPCTML